MPLLRKLLLVDDDLDEHLIMREAIKYVAAPIECAFAEKPAEAYQYLVNEANPLPDLVFLDMTMVPHSSRDFLKALKACPRSGKVPVVIYTNVDLMHEEEVLLELGGEFMLRKPFMEDLIPVLRMLAGEEQPATDLQRAKNLFQPLGVKPKETQAF